MRDTMYTKLMCQHNDYFSHSMLTCRCNFLGREVSLLMQLLEDADIPDPCASKIYISLANCQSCWDYSCLL